MIEFKSEKLTDEELENAIYDVLHDAQLALESEGNAGAKNIARRLWKDASKLYSKAIGGQILCAVEERDNPPLADGQKVQ